RRPADPRRCTRGSRVRQPGPSHALPGARAACPRLLGTGCRTVEGVTVSPSPPPSVAAHRLADHLPAGSPKQDSCPAVASEIVPSTIAGVAYGASPKSAVDSTSQSLAALTTLTWPRSLSR